MNHGWTLVVCGCGTANYWIVYTLVRSGCSEGLARLILCDSALIRKKNEITCPAYKHAGRPKSYMLTELVQQWLSTRVDIRAMHGCVEQIQWEYILKPEEVAQGHKLIVVAGLDRWTSRMVLAEDLRHYKSRTLADPLLIQVGLDRRQASVAVFGCSFSDPCPACGLGSLPDPEPCVVVTAEEKLLRGNLHSEASAAAVLVRQIISDHIRVKCPSVWINTKSNLTKSSSDKQKYDRFTRSSQMVPGCYGPHKAATPIRWDLMLEPLNMEGDLS
jgi:hypothetical protein